MKYITILITTIFLLSPITLFAEEYKNYENHYSFTIPEEWIPTTQQEINEIEKEANKSLSPDHPVSVNYIAGYKDYKNESGWLLIQEHPVAASIKTWEEQMSPFQIQQSELNPNYNLIEQGIDPRFNAYYVDAEIINGDQTIALLSVIYPGKENTTQVNYYLPAWSYKDNIQEIIDSATSFQYENGYEYQERKITDGSVEAGTGGFLGGMSMYILGAIAVGLISLFTRKKKQEKND